MYYAPSYFLHQWLTTYLTLNILNNWNTYKLTVCSSFKKKARDKIKHHFMSFDYKILNLGLN